MTADDNEKKWWVPALFATKKVWAQGSLAWDEAEVQRQTFARTLRPDEVTGTPFEATDQYDALKKARTLWSKIGVR